MHPTGSELHAVLCVFPSLAYGNSLSGITHEKKKSRQDQSMHNVLCDDMQACVAHANARSREAISDID